MNFEAANEVLNNEVDIVTLVRVSERVSSIVSVIYTPIDPHILCIMYSTLCSMVCF
jgi:hypothetical protein